MQLSEFETMGPLLYEFLAWLVNKVSSYGFCLVFLAIYSFCLHKNALFTCMKMSRLAIDGV